jgi:hypothetical protein
MKERLLLSLNSRQDFSKAVWKLDMQNTSACSQILVVWKLSSLFQFQTFLPSFKSYFWFLKCCEKEKA